MKNILRLLFLLLIIGSFTYFLDSCRKVEDVVPNRLRFVYESPRDTCSHIICRSPFWICGPFSGRYILYNVIPNSDNPNKVFAYLSDTTVYIPSYDYQTSIVQIDLVNQTIDSICEPLGLAEFSYKNGWIYFSSSEGKSRRYNINTHLTEVISNERYPCLSAQINSTGDKLALFHTSYTTRPENINILDINGTHIDSVYCNQIIGRNTHTFDISDDFSVAFSWLSYDSLFVIDIATRSISKRFPLTTFYNNPQAGPLVEYGCISPDNSKIVLSGPNGFLGLIDLNTGEQKILRVAGCTNHIYTKPVFSADGLKIISGYEDRYAEVGYDIYSLQSISVMNVDGSDEKIIRIGPN